MHGIRRVSHQIQMTIDWGTIWTIVDSGHNDGFRSLPRNPAKNFERGPLAHEARCRSRRSGIRPWSLLVKCVSQNQNNQAPGRHVVHVFGLDAVQVATPYNAISDSCTQRISFPVKLSRRAISGTREGKNKRNNISFTSSGGCDGNRPTCYSTKRLSGAYV